jgi:hypothetical protein
MGAAAGGAGSLPKALKTLTKKKKKTARAGRGKKKSGGGALAR